MFGTGADDVTCISAQDFGGFTCSSTGTHYASLVLTPTQNTVVARHSGGSSPTFIKLIVQEIAQSRCKLRPHGYRRYLHLDTPLRLH